MAIISFRSRALRRLFENDDTRGIYGRHVYRVRDILLALDQAIRVDDMNAYPGWRLHPLKGELRGFANPIRVDGQRLAQAACSPLGADNEALLGKLT